MGNLVSCCGHQEVDGGEEKAKPPPDRGQQKLYKQHSKRAAERARDALLLQDEAILALALQQHQRMQARVERTMSQRHADPNTSLRRNQLPRSMSARARNVSDLMINPSDLVNGVQDQALSADLESKHFVLIHGGGHGAWCWYKSIALLEESGFTATAIDLVGSGIDFQDPNTVTCLSQYVKPLLDFLEQLPKNEKVILVGHNIGGACISHAMEVFSSKISKAIFVAGTMVTSGQRAYDVFTHQAQGAGELMEMAQKFCYVNGNLNPPTSIEFDKKLLRDLFYNQSAAKDVALATVSVRPVPFAPAMEKLQLSQEKYGSVRRFYIETTDDNVFTATIHQSILRLNPPEKVFRVKGSDHSPFFSKPQSLNKFFHEIALLT